MPKNAPLQSDCELARSAAEGDRAAFEAIVRRYTRPLTEFAAHKTAVIQDAEDIVQETFLRAFLNLNTFDPRFSLKNWLFTIAYRLIVSSYRKKKPARLDSRTCAAMVDGQSHDDAPMDWLWELAEALDPSAHTVLWLRYKQDMDISEIARVMNRSTLAVRVLLHRARRRLADHMETAAGPACDHRTRQDVLLEGTTRL